MLAQRPAQSSPDRSATWHGVRIERRDDLISDRVWQAIRDGSYEVAELRAGLGALREGDRLLDIGAGLGIIGAVLATRTGVERILSVEADPRLIPYMRRLHACNNIANVDVLNCVPTAAPQDGAVLYVRTDFWRSSLDPATGPYAQAVRVPTRTLGSLLGDFRPTVVISDIEGAEVELFGAPQDFSGVRVIVMELHLRNYPDPTLAAVDRIFRSLAAQGFAYLPGLSSGEVVTFHRIRNP